MPKKSPPPKPATPPVSADDKRLAEARRRDLALEKDARALFDRGDASAAIALLKERAVLLAGHGVVGGALPCLCLECLAPAGDAADVGGVTYRRDFVVSRHRVLFYWAPEELWARVGQLRRSMRAEVAARLRLVGRGRHEDRQVPNPFTRQPMTQKAQGRRSVGASPFVAKARGR